MNKNKGFTLIELFNRVISGNSNTCNTNGNSSTKDIKCNRK